MQSSCEYMFNLSLFILRLGLVVALAVHDLHDVVYNYVHVHVYCGGDG